MTELLVVVAIVIAVVLVGRLILTSRRNHRAWVAHVRARGWEWMDRVPDAAGDGSAAQLPHWLQTTVVPALRIAPHKKAIYTNCYAGTLGAVAVCGFDRAVRRRRGKDEGHFASFLVLQDPELPVDLPDFFLVRSHGLTNALAQLDDGFRRLNENLSGSPESDYGLREAVPGYEQWRVHATAAGAQWLATSTGARFVRALESFDAIPQHAFGVSGNLILAEGMSGSIERMETLLADAQAFGRHLHEALGNQVVTAAANPS